MLPVFPHARSATRDTFQHFVSEAQWNSSPVLKDIRVRAQAEGREASYQRHDGKVVEIEYESFRVERKIPIMEARGLDPESFFEIASGIGAEIGAQMERAMINVVSEATEEVGNVIVSKTKGGISFEDFLEMNSMMQVEFGPDGEPNERTLLLSPEMHLVMRSKLAEWQNDPIKQAALAAVMLKKRGEYNEREARRRMVD